MNNCTENLKKTSQGIFDMSVSFQIFFFQVNMSAIVFCNPSFLSPPYPVSFFAFITFSLCFFSTLLLSPPFSLFPYFLSQYSCLSSPFFFIYPQLVSSTVLVSFPVLISSPPFLSFPSFDFVSSLLLSYPLLSLPLLSLVPLFPFFSFLEMDKAKPHSLIHR